MILKQSGEADYGLSIRAAFRGLWTGNLDYFSFVDSMILTINRGFMRAWAEGAATCGMKPGDMTQEEIDRLAAETYKEATYVIGLADDIIKNSRANGGKLGPLIVRSQMWVNRYVAIRGIAATIACGDLKFRWKMHPLKEHCSSCLKLDGRVYRGSVWKKYNVYPRHRALACNGYKCGCEFVQTDDPVTPGRPPSLP